MKALFAGLMMTDGVFTFWATNHGYTEVNPLMAPIANTPMYVVYKVITAIVAVVIVSLLATRFPRVRKFARTGIIAGTVLYALVLASNLWEVLA